MFSVIWCMLKNWNVLVEILVLVMVVSILCVFGFVIWKLVRLFEMFLICMLFLRWLLN